MSLFLFQREKSPNALPNIALFSEDVAAAFARVDEYNWLHYKDKHQCMARSLPQLSSMSLRTLRKCIPVGSIEFVENVLQLAHNIPKLSPIVLPAEILTHPEWMGRRYEFRDSIVEATDVFTKFNTDNLFIKSASYLKTDYTGVYNRTDTLPQTDDAIFFSECIEFSSEWRAFVSRSKLVDIRCYAGDPWLMPDKQTVLKMISSIGNKYPAYTLDVGVTKPAGNCSTVAIEVHNFISCGLYGAVVPLKMYVDAYRFELKSHAK